MSGSMAGIRAIPIDFDIFPPPRPSPDATLVQQAGGCRRRVQRLARLFAAARERANHVHVQFTAPIRQVDVTDAGEMIFQSGRGYEGQWYVYWVP